MNWSPIEDTLEGLDRSVGTVWKHEANSRLWRIGGRKRVAIGRFFAASGMIALVMGLNGCMIVDAPIKGILGTEVVWGDIATGKSGSATPDESKEGKACAESILGLLARGDASVRAAKENGNITEVTSVDHSARNLLNIVGEWCTIVKGH
jgi:hypothetical protein